MPPLQRYLQDLLHGYGHDEKEQQVSIVVDRAVSSQSQRSKEAIKSAHDKMTNLFQEINESQKLISDKSIIHTQTDTTASHRCQCFDLHSAIETSPTRTREPTDKIGAFPKRPVPSTPRDAASRFRIPADHLGDLCLHSLVLFLLFQVPNVKAYNVDDLKAVVAKNTAMRQREMVVLPVPETPS